MLEKILPKCHGSFIPVGGLCTGTCWQQSLQPPRVKCSQKICVFSNTFGKLANLFVDKRHKNIFNTGGVNQSCDCVLTLANTYDLRHSNRYIFNYLDHGGCMVKDRLKNYIQKFKNRHTIKTDQLKYIKIYTIQRLKER